MSMLRCVQLRKEQRERTDGFLFKNYLGTWPSYLTNLLSLRLVGAVGTRINVRNSYSQWWPTPAWI